MKSRSAGTLAAVLVLGLAVGAQEPLTPAASAAKAKQLIQQTIQALGGQAYLGARDQTCEGRVAFFGHHNDVNDYELVRDFNIFPDKERTEYSEKGNIIDLYNGNQGWTLDRSGVSAMPASAVADFQGGLKRDINQLFRFRMNEPGLEFSYGGPDVVDLNEVDWVEIDDAEQRTTRIAISRISHLPVRAVYISRDPVTHERTEETEYFSNYQPVQGIETAFQDTRARDNQKTYQLWIRDCRYNTGLSPEYFTRESLEQRWAKVGGKKRHGR
ncbi:MAG TPA: hypothetical protein VGS20_05655 [Candidatus Acidoferrales bacterium]|nr:hypothetical protein [Candidatus Acidoferrales bacterium]